MTIHAWIYIDKIDDIEQLIVYFGSITGEIEIGLNNMGCGIAAKLNNQIWYGLLDSVPIKQWVQIIAFFKKGDSLNLVIGCKINSLNIPNFYLNTTHPYRTSSSIGSYNRSERGFFSRIIDELRIYNRILTNKELLILSDLKLNSKLSLCSLISNVGAENFHIPIKAALNCQNIIAEDLSFDMKVRFNASTFSPTGLTKGKILKDSIDKDFFRNLTIQCDSVNITDKDSILTEIIGTVLLGDSLTKLEIIDFKWNNSSIEIDTIIHGSLQTTVCAFPIRQVQLFTPTTFSIQPNPTNGYEIEIKFEGDEEGLHILEIYNIQGIIIETNEWNRKKRFQI